MTRINVVPVQELSRQHLIAEYREITRLPKNLNKSLNRDKPFNMDEIPKQYVLGKGHVKFFYNKMGYLKNRFEELVCEMIKRGYNPNYTDATIFDVGAKWMGNYVPTEHALDINRARIKERS